MTWPWSKPEPVYTDREFRQELEGIPMGVLAMLESGLIARRAGPYNWEFWQADFGRGGVRLGAAGRGLAGPGNADKELAT